METLTLTAGTLRQSSFDKVGDGLRYEAVEFKTGSYKINTPIEFNDGTTVIGPDDCSAVLTLINSAPTSTFGLHVPMFGGDKIKDINISGITFDGNATNQQVKWGAGYHDFVYFTNSSNIVVKNTIVQNSMGDGLRVDTGDTIEFSGNKVYGCGHDAFYTLGCSNVKAFDNDIYIRVNSALRCKGSKNVEYYNNIIRRISKYSPATGPGMQIEVSASKETSSEVSVHDNYVEGTQGPGMWVVAHTNTSKSAATGLKIFRNIFKDCGQMPAAVNLPGVAGISWDGWNGEVYNNVFDGCYGAGFRIGNYITTSPGTGYEVTFRDNIVVNTRNALKPDSASGYPIVNIRTNHVVTCSGNAIYNNIKSGCYKVTNSNGYSVDPLFVGNGDYHLKSTAGHFTSDGFVMDDTTSPLIFETYEISPYNGTGQASKYPIIKEPNEIVGENPAVIVVCETEEDAVKLAESIENAVVYVPTN